MLTAPDALWILVAALCLDAVIGDPDVIWRRWPHPAALMGRAIAAFDETLNRSTDSFAARRRAGVAALVAVVGSAAVVGWCAEVLLRAVPGGVVVLALVASIFLAQASLYRHVARVRAAFASGGLGAARQAVAMIVGRNPDSLDQAGVCRAAIESCAENFSDGVVAPALWFALAGLPGLLVYKVVNTADSMIGHRTDRHEAFGWAAARTDDLMNIVPARFTAVLIAATAAVVGGRPSQCLNVAWRDAGRHRSPNAGWPESAMAAALCLALAGPRRYGDTLVVEPFLNAAGRRDAAPDDIGRALRLFVAASLLHVAVYAALALAV